MPTPHPCECEVCQQAEFHPDQALHQQMNLFLSRLNEQQRRWYAALEAQKMGRGGATFLAKVTGLSVETIRRGRDELANQLVARPVDRVRQPGGGRQPVEKKSQA